MSQPDTPNPRPRITSCILLAGGPRPSPLTVESGYSVLDLSPTPDRTLLGLWIERIAPLASLDHTMSLRVVTGQGSPEPVLECDPGPLELSIAPEKRRYRGPVGVARDEAQALRGDDLVMIIEGARLPGSDLLPLAATHQRTDSDITVGINPDDSPAGVYVLRRATLDLVPKVGFMDLKEQWLPKAREAGMRIHTHRFDAPGVMLVRTREQFLQAARTLNNLPDPRQSVVLTAPDTTTVGHDETSVIASSATVAQGAVVTGSVVMEHATVAAGAIVARSIVCPKAVVGAEMTVLDSVVGRSAVQLSVKRS